MAADPILNLSEAARAVVHRYLPGHVAGRVVVFTEDGRKAVDTLIPVAAPVAAGRADDMEDAILEAIGDKTLTGQQIADASGYPFDRYLRSKLAAMRRRGVLTGREGESGYAVSES